MPFGTTNHRGGTLRSLLHETAKPWLQTGDWKAGLPFDGTVVWTFAGGLDTVKMGFPRVAQEGGVCHSRMTHLVVIPVQKHDTMPQRIRLAMVDTRPPVPLTLTALAQMGQNFELGSVTTRSCLGGWGSSKQRIQHRQSVEDLCNPSPWTRSPQSSKYMYGWCSGEFWLPYSGYGRWYSRGWKHPAQGCSEEGANGRAGVPSGTSMQGAQETSNASNLALPHATSGPCAFEAGQTPARIDVCLRSKRVGKGETRWCRKRTRSPSKWTAHTFL